MPDIEDIYELEDGFRGGGGEVLESTGSGSEPVEPNGNLNRLEIRHAIEARHEERRIARELDSLDFEMD